MNEPSYKRPLVAELQKALRQDLPFLHVIAGPRQSGKTTAATCPGGAGWSKMQSGHTF